ncbi:hypothetical protein AOLI_G00049540 [Acnodon oligacanthus]
MPSVIPPPPPPPVAVLQHHRTRRERGEFKAAVVVGLGTTARMDRERDGWTDGAAVVWCTQRSGEASLLLHIEPLIQSLLYSLRRHGRLSASLTQHPLLKLLSFFTTAPETTRHAPW